MINCAYCNVKGCKDEILDRVPKDCPSLKTSVENETSRYDEEDKDMSVISAKIEAGGYGVLTRIEEIMEFAIQSGYQKLGLAFCVGFTNEAHTVAQIFKSNGFDVVSVCCKNGAVDKTVFGIDRDHFVIPENEREAMCNPAGQAALLDGSGCELCILLGLCVGHDTIFMKHCKTPVTVLAVKDRVTGHNPLAPVYTSATYRHGLYDYRKNRASRYKFSDEDPCQ